MTDTLIQTMQLVDKLTQTVMSQHATKKKLIQTLEHAIQHLADLNANTSEYESILNEVKNG